MTPTVRLSFLLPLLALGACSEPQQRSLTDLVRDGSALLDPESLEPFTGVAFATYEGPSTNLTVKESFAEGRKHGPYEWYAKSGTLFERGMYRNGILDGPYEAFWDTGGLYEKGTYVAGNFEGPREWYAEGHLIEAVTYTRGVLDGPYARYADDGTPLRWGRLHAGSPCGIWNEDGNEIEHPACPTNAIQ